MKIFFYKIKWTLLTVLILIQQNGLSQDPHFSQYFASPLTFNPALTGYFEGNQRLSVNYRNQLNAGGDPYTTGTVSFETKILSDKISTNDKWGLGIHALYDQSTAGIYKNSYLSFSTGFNKGLDEDGLQSIGIGVQATMGHNDIDFSKISFNSQFTGNGFDLSIPSGEAVNNRTVSYFDVNAGLLYNYSDETGNQYSLGAAIFHLLQPGLSFFSGNNPVISQRFTVHAGASLVMNEKDNLFISAHIMKQGSAHELVIGAAYGLGIGTTDLSLYAGAWLRAKDALYPYLGLKSSNYQLGLSYDIMNNDINKVNRYSGSTEVSFIYLFNSNGRKKGIPCFF